MKRLLINGSGSFVGSTIQAHLDQWPDRYSVSAIDMQSPDLRTADFSPYDSVFLVAGLAHANVGRVSEERKALSYKVHSGRPAERDKYGANAPKPGLTGWAQINGRDELEIPVKARFDGDYTALLARGGFHAFFFDCRCFFGTVFSVARGEGVVEGGTGALRKHPPAR